MAITPSNMIPLGTQAPNFSLKDVVSGEEKSLQQMKGGRATLVMFICNHCPYVKHILPALAQLTTDYLSKSVSFVAISSNDVQQIPEDGPEYMRQLVKDYDLQFPYLYDETQDVAKLYDAACTPDFFLFDENLKLVYRGQFDDSRPSNKVPLSGNHLRTAINAVLAGEIVSPFQRPSIGCNIKWKV